MIPGSSLPDPPSLIYALTPQSLLLATDSSALHLYDLRNPLSKLSSTPQATHHPHADYISSLTPLPPTAASTSGFPKQFVTTGGSTLAVTDLRRGVLVKSEDQEEELLSSVFVSGVGKDGKGERVLVGTGSGVLTVWEKGVWEDQQGRVIVDGVGKESLDALTLVPGEQGTVGVGMGDGKVKFVKMGSNQVVGECRHDELEGVVGLGFDVGGRVISGGGGVVKVWQESVEEEYEGEEADRVDGVDGVGRKRGLDDSDDDNEDEGDSESSEEEEKVRKKGRKRKRGNEKAKNGGKAVMGFTGID
ncbi:WD repeat-containing protein jip5 [Trapelia coarctata]|nr:WD repeat-containing protein jip5 [Trapelia coarctata]